MPDDDPIRIYARDVGLDPQIGGAANVQQLLTATGGGATLGNFSTDRVHQDTPDALTGDGSITDVHCLIAAPPAWMDNAGNITEPGLYWVGVTVAATAGPTTPAQYIRVSSAFSASYFVPCDAIGASGVNVLTDVQALAAGDLPYDVTCSITMPTDATEAVNVSIRVDRLAH